MPGKIITTRGGTAVMQNRAPQELSQDTPEMALQRRLDLFATPPWASRAGAEVLSWLDPDCATVVDPCAGQGHMAGPMAERFNVATFDIHLHAPWLAPTPAPVQRDWLDWSAWRSHPQPHWIVANPPFKIAEQFVTLGLERANRGVALLLRLSFLESAARYPLMRNLTLLAPFSERVPMVLGGWDHKIGSATSYAWFFWAKGKSPRAPYWIAPGTKARLTRHDDVARYAKRDNAPLFPDV